MTDRQVAGIFSLVWGLALMSATGFIYTQSATFYRADIFPYQMEVFLVLYLTFGSMFHLSMIGNSQIKWLNVSAAGMSFLFLIFFHTYPIPRSASVRYLTALPVTFWATAWIIVSIADYREIFDDKK